MGLEQRSAACATRRAASAGCRAAEDELHIDRTGQRDWFDSRFLEVD